MPIALGDCKRNGVEGTPATRVTPPKGDCLPTPTAGDISGFRGVAIGVAVDFLGVDAT